MIKVTTKEQAWQKANELFPTDYMKNDRLSERAGYDVYTSTSVAFNGYFQIDDLGDRLEVIIDGESINIWIVDYTESDLAEALKQINNADYYFGDRVNSKLAEAMGLSSKTFQKAFKVIGDILKRDYPESNLIKLYNL